jgi:single-stranded-DNA-specific exonuclease
LLAPELGLARQYAAELDALNVERRTIEQSMQLEAQAFLSKLSFDGSSMPECLCLYRSDWHQGVIGILAGRIKEQFHRPTIIFAQGDNGELKGSARSISGLHIRDLLEEIASQYPGLIKKFGGHAMAAGLTIAAERLETFQLALSLTAKKHLTAEQLTAVIYSDGELAADCFDIGFAQLLQNAGPWGQAFPEPVFDGEFTLISQKMLAERHLKLMLQGPGGLLVDAIWFNADNKTWPDVNVKKAHLAYQLDINEYRDQRNLQLIVRYMTALN